MAPVDTPSTAPEPSYRAVFYDAADAILILADDKTIVEANPAASALFGAPADALVGRSFGDLHIDGGDEMMAVWRELLALGEVKREAARRREPEHQLPEQAVPGLGAHRQGQGHSGAPAALAVIEVDRP